MERRNYKRMQSDQNARYALILTADARRYDSWTMNRRSTIFAFVLSLVLLWVSLFQLYAGSLLNDFVKFGSPADNNFEYVMKAIEEGRIELTEDKALELIRNQREVLRTHVGAFENAKPAFQMFGLVLSIISFMLIIVIIYVFRESRKES